MEQISKERLENSKDRIIPPEELIKRIDERIAFLEEQKRKGIEPKEPELTEEERQNLDKIYKMIDMLTAQENAEKDLLEKYINDIEKL